MFLKVLKRSNYKVVMSCSFFTVVTMDAQPFICSNNDSIAEFTYPMLLLQKASIRQSMKQTINFELDKRK